MGDVFEGVDVGAAGEALAMLTCPRRIGTGVCAIGCRDERACGDGCEPTGGWSQQLRNAVVCSRTVPADPTLDAVARGIEAIQLVCPHHWVREFSISADWDECMVCYAVRDVRA